MNCSVNRKLITILNEASFAPKRVYTLYFYYTHQVDLLPLDATEKQNAYDLLKQILDIKLED